MLTIWSYQHDSGRQGSALHLPCRSYSIRQSIPLGLSRKTKLEEALRRLKTFARLPTFLTGYGCVFTIIAVQAAGVGSPFQ